MARAAGAGMRLGGVDGGVHTFEVQLSRRSTGRLGLDVTLVSVEQEVGLVVEDIISGGAVELWNQRVHESRRIRAGDIIIRVNGAEGDASGLATELRSGADVLLTVQRSLAEEPPPAPPAPDTHLAFGRGQGGQGQPRPGSGYWPPWSPPDGPTAEAAWPPPAEPRQGLLRKALEGASMPHLLAAAPGGPPQGQPAPAVENRSCTFVVSLVVPEGVRLGIDVLPISVSDTQALSVKKVSAGGAVHRWNQTNPEHLRIRNGDCIMCVNGVLSDLPRMLEELRTRRELHFLIQRHPARAGAPAPAQAQPPPGGAAQTQGGWGATPPGLAPHPASGVPPAPALAGPGAPARAPAPREPEGPRGGYGVGVPPANAKRRGAAAGACGGPPARQPEGPAEGPPLPGGLGIVEVPGNRLRFEVEVERTPGVPLGINVMPVVDGGVSRLMVERVATNGSVHAWNLLNWAPRQVQAGDIIAQVNGVGLLERMAEEFNRESTRVHITVERPSAQQMAPDLGASGPGPGQQQWAGGARPQPPPGPRGRQSGGGADAAAADALAGLPARGPPAPGGFAAAPPARGPALPAHGPAAAPRAAQQTRPGAGLGAPQQQHHQLALQHGGGADATAPWEGGAPRAPAFASQTRAALGGGSLAEAVSALPPPRVPPGGPGGPGRPKAPSAPPPELLALQRLAKGAGPASLDAESQRNVAWRAARPQANSATQPGSWLPEEAETAGAGWAPSAPSQANGASQPSPWPSDSADAAVAEWAPPAPRRPQAGAAPGAAPPATALARPAAAAPAARAPRAAASPPAARASFGGAGKDPGAAAAPPAREAAVDPDPDLPPGLPAAGGGEAEAEAEAGAAGPPRGGATGPKALFDDTGGVVLPPKEAGLLRSAMLLPDDELVELLRLTLETRPSICDHVAEAVAAAAAPAAGWQPEAPAGTL